MCKVECWLAVTRVTEPESQAKVTNSCAHLFLSFFSLSISRPFFFLCFKFHR